MSFFATPQERFSKTFLLLLTLGISIMFFMMIRPFLVTVLLAGIFTAMIQPAHARIVRLVRGNNLLASIITILVVVILIAGPLTTFLAIVVGQAVDVSQSVGPWIERQLSQPDELGGLIDRIPYADRIRPYQDQIVSKLGELAGTIGSFVVSRVAAATRLTATFVLNLFVMLYAMFFFLTTGKKLLQRILYYMPLSPNEENQMAEKFVSVTRATLKGTMVIGVIQGALCGIAYWATGINSAVFWGTITAVLSVIPGIGGALVWVPAAVYLVATGHPGLAVALTVWCALIVGSVDNVLRPRLVGRDTKMSDLLILLSTLGGIFLFGAVGFIIGPIIAALFVTVWEIYGEAFKGLLPNPTMPIGSTTE
jgi:predicted PurR-regulated permease PerM